MEKTADTRLIAPADLLVAGALLTRLPLPYAPAQAFARQARAGWAFPIIGAVLGALVTVVWLLASYCALPPQITAVLAIATLCLMTGALHEDGLADSFDGLWGGHDPARRLEIMKDSAIGSYGVLALIVAFATKWNALSLFSGPAPLVAAVCMSRAVLPSVMHLMPQARRDGLAAKVGTPPRSAALLALAIGTAFCSLVLGFGSALLTLAVAALVAAALALIAQRKIGGVTGDILGATQQLSEIAILIVLLPAAVT